MQWIFPVPLLIAAIFAPSSPWWLVRRGRKDDAVKAMKRLSDDTVDHQSVVTLIEHTVELERQLNFGSSYSALFKGIDRRRTEIAVVTWCAQTAVGFCIQGYQTYFFTQACVVSFDVRSHTVGWPRQTLSSSPLALTALPLSARRSRCHCSNALTAGPSGSPV